MSGKPTLVIPAEVAARIADRQPRCGNCRFMRRDAAGRDQECHVGPPTPTVMLVPTQPPKLPGMELKVFSAWPVINEQFWCAKHEPKLDG